MTLNINEEILDEKDRTSTFDLFRIIIIDQDRRLTADVISQEIATRNQENRWNCRCEKTTCEMCTFFRYLILKLKPPNS